MRNVRRAHKSDAEPVAPGWRLLLRLAAQRKRLRVERRVATDPEDGAVRLTGIKAAKVSPPSSAKAAAPKASTFKPAAETSAGSAPKTAAP